MELIVDIRKKLPGFTLQLNFKTGQEAIGLLGASGAGKSMTLRCIAGIEKPDQGKIVLNGRVLFDSDKRINLLSRKRKVGYLFQNYALFPHLTIEQNIGFALDKIPAREKKAIVGEKIRMMKLEGLEGRYPFQISGGQQQRAALARALIMEPEALLLDEPFSALDDNLRNLMAKQLLEILSAYYGVVLFVTHNMDEAYRICKKLVFLKEGQIEASGDKEDIFQTPPTTATAQLTGCKNFSAADFLSEHRLYATDWGIELFTTKTLNKELKQTGIRANYIRAASSADRENVFECWPVFTSETPFRMTVYLSIGKKGSGSEDYQLQWEMSKEKWLELKEQMVPWKICLDPARLMLFTS